MAYALIAAGAGMLGPYGPPVAEGAFVAVVVLVAVAWPVGAPGGTGRDLGRARAAVAQVALAAPIWAVATGADAVADIVVGVALVASIGISWALAANVWPAGAAWVAAGSVVLACVPRVGTRGSVVAWASAPRAFVEGVASTLAHVGIVGSVVALGVLWTRVRYRLTSS